MKLFVVGHGRHGKDSAALVLGSELNLTFQSSSWIMIHTPEIYSKFPQYSGPSDLFANRHKHRAELYDAIVEYNTPDASKLSQKIFDQCDMYVGLRNVKELKASRHLADLVIWVDAQSRMPLESQASMTITSADCDIIVENNFDEADFHQKLRKLCKLLRK